MTTLTIPLPQLEAFMVIFLRVSAILMTLPFFDNRSVPLLFKAGLALALSVLLFPLVDVRIDLSGAGAIVFGLGVVSELLLGFAIGLTAQLVFAGIKLAGQLAGFQMGLAIANVIDPVTSTQVSIVSQIQNLVAMLLFLSMNAHHMFLRALVDSFHLVPPFHFQANAPLVRQIIELGGQMFVIAIQVGAPVVAALLLTTVALGLIARTVPQMNIFIVAMPVKILVGLLFLGLSLPFLATFLSKVFNRLTADILLLLKLMAI